MLVIYRSTDDYRCQDTSASGVDAGVSARSNETVQVRLRVLQDLLRDLASPGLASQVSRPLQYLVHTTKMSLGRSRESGIGFSRPEHGRHQPGLQLT